MIIQTIQVNAELMGVIDDYVSYIRMDVKTGDFIGIDKNGNKVVSQPEYQFARDNDLFPVKLYRLISVTENAAINSNGAEGIHVHNIGGLFHTHFRYLLVTGIKQDALLGLFDFDGLNIILTAVYKNANPIVPINIDLGYKGKYTNAKVIGRLSQLKSSEVAEFFPMKFVCSQKPGKKKGKFIEATEYLDRNLDAFLLHVFYSFKLPINPEETIIIKIPA